MNGVNIILYLYFHQIEIFQMMKNVFALQTGICLTISLAATFRNNIFRSKIRTVQKQWTVP